MMDINIYQPASTIIYDFCPDTQDDLSWLGPLTPSPTTYSGLLREVFLPFSWVINYFHLVGSFDQNSSYSSFISLLHFSVATMKREPTLSLTPLLPFYLMDST